MRNENKRSGHRLQEVEVRLCLKKGKALYSRKQICDPESAAEAMSGMLKQIDREMFCVVNLDTRNRPINYSIVSIGGIDSSIVSYSDVFKSTILSNSKKVIAMHNHPSGETMPSRSDLEATERLVRVGRILGIEVIDSLVVGGINGEIFSIREAYGELFTNLSDQLGIAEPEELDIDI